MWGFVKIILQYLLDKYSICEDELYCRSKIYGYFFARLTKRTISDKQKEEEIKQNKNMKERKGLRMNKTIDKRERKKND